jgi:tetratricopeptide (TPR) repeat protein
MAMTGPLSTFTKEQWLCYAAVGVSLLLLFAAGPPTPAAGTDTQPSAARERTVVFPIVAERSPLRANWQDYEGGRNVFAPPGKTRLPLPELPLPHPPIEAPALPPFSPHPDLRSLFQDTKWPGLFVDAAKPPIPAADVDLAHWQAAAALAIPVVSPPKDMRGEFVPGREFDEVRLLDETNRVVRGRIPDKEGTGAQKDIVTVIDEQNRVQRFPRNKVSIIYSQTFQQKYLEDAKNVGDSIRDRLALARWCVKLGMIPEAKTEYEFLCRRKQDEFAALDELVELYLADLEFEKAVELLESSLQRVQSKDKITRVQVRLGGVWERLGIHDRALAEYEQAFPSVTEAGVLRGRVLYRKGALREAVDALNEALRLPIPAENVGPLGYALRGLARMRLSASPEGLKAALADFDEALRRLPREPHARTGRAVVRAVQGDYKGAMEDLAAALASDQYHAPAWINMAILLIGRGALEEAEACIAAGLRRCPGAHDLHSLRGIVKLARSKSEEAAADFEASHRVSRDNYYAHYGQGIVHLRAGRFAEAERSLVEAIKRGFYFTPSYYNAAVSNMRAGELATAEALLRELIRQKPGHRDAIVALTLLQLRQGRIAEARTTFGEVVDRIAGNPTLLYLHGYITFSGDDPNVERQVMRARDQMLDAAAAGSASATAVIRELNEWLATYVLFHEQFAREDGPRIGAGWNQNDSPEAFPIRIVKERCRFHSGRSAGESTDLLYFSLEREIPGKDFRSVEATFYPTVVRKLDAFGVALLIHQGSAGFRGPAARLRFDPALGRPVLSFVPSVAEDQLRKEARWVTSPLPIVLDSDEIRLRMILYREEGGSFIGLDVYDKSKKDWVAAVQRQGFQAPSTSFKLAFFVRTRMNAEYELEVDNVRVLERKADE